MCLAPLNKIHQCTPPPLRTEPITRKGRAEAGELRREVEAAQLAQAETEAEAEDLRQAAIVRQGRGLVARLRAAWRARSKLYGNFGLAAAITPPTPCGRLSATAGWRWPCSRALTLASDDVRRR